MRGAPYSGEGQTTVTQTLADGTHIERTVRAKLLRRLQMGEGAVRHWDARLERRRTGNHWGRDRSKV